MGCGGWSNIKHWLCWVSPGEESVGFPGPSSYSDSMRTEREYCLREERCWPEIGLFYNGATVGLSGSLRKGNQ